jgi:hypothetical protein
LLHSEDAFASLVLAYEEQTTILKCSVVQCTTQQQRMKRNHDCITKHNNPLRKSKRLATHLSLHELFQQRCHTCSLCSMHTCSLCSMPDCGICESCIINQSSTSLSRLVCLINICSKIPMQSKLQPAIHGWQYYFEKKGYKCPRSILGLHKTYHRLRLVPPHPKTSPSLCILAAIHECTSNQDQLELGAFFETTIGIPLRERHSHELVSKGYLQEYLSVDGTKKAVFGTITNCSIHLIDRALSFTVKYNENETSTSNLIVSSDAVAHSCPTEEVVSEQMAWGGYERFCTMQQRYPRRQNKDCHISAAIPYSRKWIVPLKRYLVNTNNVEFPYLFLEFCDFTLRLEVKTSKIPGAGNGLFVKCVHGKKPALNAGEMIDMGVYAPLRGCDCKSKHISVLKNLIYDWEMEIWSFATKMKTLKDYVFDPTEDCTGIRHVDAKRNIISYTNEIISNGEIASVSAHYDPEGNVHYLLGHWEEQEGVLTIPSVGQPLEVLVRK